jgi:hypothetical protein
MGRGWACLSPLAQHWLTTARISPVIADAAGFGWDEGTQELFIPIHRRGELAGWLARRFDEDRRKYDTLTEDRSNFYSHHATGSKLLVLTEDALSALRCSEICDSMGLLGVAIKPAVITAILRGGYDEVVVFLDGDNPQVRMAARAIAKRLPFLRTRIVETGCDPKDYSKGELECLILKS